METIRTAYGKQVSIFVVCGPMASGQVCLDVQQAAADFDLTYVDMQHILLASDLGCNGNSQKLFLFVFFFNIYNFTFRDGYFCFFFFFFFCLFVCSFLICSNRSP